MKNLSPEQVADHLEISSKTYRKYENNESSPNLDKLEKIAEILDKTLFDFLPDNIAQNNSEQKGGIALVVNSTINQLSEKLIEQYEERIKVLEEQLEYWKSKSGKK